MNASIYGLTLWQPIATIMALGYKRIENRTWKPPQRLTERSAATGQPLLALHAGNRFCADYAQMARDRGVPESVLDVARHTSGVIVALCEVPRFVTESSDPWFLGTIGWIIENVRAIEPVSCRGMQGVWALPPAVECVVRANYLAALWA